MIRRASPDDAYTIARLRDEMAFEMRPDEQRDPTFRERAFVYWYEKIEAGTIVAWMAEEQGQTVGMGSLLLHHHPPLPFGERRRGYVTGVYVIPEARRNGHGKALMDALIDYGREADLQRLELRTSDMGRALYESVGFEPVELMILKLNQ